MKEENKQTARRGRYQGSGRGFGFFVPEDSTDRANDLFIPPRRENGAWDGDTVMVEADPENPNDPGRTTGRVVEIVERVNKVVTGTVAKVDHEAWLRPDNDRLPSVIKIVSKDRIHEGEKAAVALTNYGGGRTPPMGTLKETFGVAGSRKSSTEAILYRLDIQRDFPEPVLEQARAIPQKLPKEACAGRKDLREKIIITIDGASSKDLDDAVSLEKKGRNWELGVHIADVSAYVTEDSPLDLEAFRRGTSVYFADQVIPMLPVELSNGICSLNPQVDRLALSCFMTIDEDGQILEHSVCQSVMRSTERMTYDDCNDLLEGGHAELEERYKRILPMLRDMDALHKKLLKRRELRGALDLDSSESYIICDETGAPVDIVSKTPGESEGLIESFMLAANETVAKHLFDLKKPGVFRVHEKPSQEKTENLIKMLTPLGFNVKEADNFTLQKVLEKAKTTPEASAVSTMVLRSLMKARYDVQNLGHFGLAAPYYCHFTSPIRRYPDLMVHRCLHALLDGALVGGPAEKKLAKSCESAATQSSTREVAAQNAERDIDKLYFAEYMKGHVGETFTASVSGVTKFGLFAALPSGVEGLIPVETLPDDRYVYDEQRLTLTGERVKRVFTFGMELPVVCVAADEGVGQVDFRLPGQESVPGRAKPAPKPIPRAGAPLRPGNSPRPGGGGRPPFRKR